MISAQRDKLSGEALRAFSAVVLLFAHLAVGLHWAQHLTASENAVYAADQAERTGAGPHDPAGHENGGGAECAVCHTATSASTPADAVVAFASFVSNALRPDPHIAGVASAAIPAAFQPRGPPRIRV